VVVADLVVDPASTQPIAQIDSSQTVGIPPVAQPWFGIDNAGKLDGFFQLGATEGGYETRAPAPDDSGTAGALPNDRCIAKSPGSGTPQMSGETPDATARSVSLLQAALLHRAEWIPGAEHDLVLIGSSTVDAVL